MTEVEQDPTITRFGFTRALYLTDTQLDGILERLAAGDKPGVACRSQGTSFTQFIRRVKKDEALYKRYRDAENKGRRQQADLSS